MLVPFVRTILLYSVVAIAIRLMGKRQVGEMQPTELVITILVSAVASVPMQNLDIPLSYGIVPVFTLVLFEILISFLSLKLPTFKRLLTGKPVIVIENGQLIQKALADTRFSIDDLFEELRMNSVFSLDVVRQAQIETNGQLSIMLYDKEQPLTFKAMGVDCPNSPMLYTVITDGFISKENLSKLGLDRAWLNAELAKRHLTTEKQVYLMIADKDKNTVIVKKEAA